MPFMYIKTKSKNSVAVLRQSDQTMFLRKTVNKTKYFIHRTYENLRSLMFGDYQKLPKAQPLVNNPQMNHLDHFYREFTEHWESDGKKLLHRKKKRKEPGREEDNTSKGNVVEYTNEETRIEENDKQISCSKNSKCRGGRDGVFEEKMKELEKLDVNDVDHVLDIEEIIHYHSRLTCPVYLDLIDTFFTQIYSDFSLPDPSDAASSTSIRRITPV